MRGLSLVALLLAGFTTAARAQSQQHWSIQGSGALVFPTASESDFENSTRCFCRIRSNSACAPGRGSFAVRMYAAGPSVFAMRIDRLDFS